MITDEVLAQLETLPADMFTKGDDGKQKFIEALQSGDASEATAQLANTAKVGAESVDLTVTGQQKRMNLTKVSVYLATLRKVNNWLKPRLVELGKLAVKLFTNASRYC